MRMGDCMGPLGVSCMCFLCLCGSHTLACGLGMQISVEWYVFDGSGVSVDKGLYVDRYLIVCGQVGPVCG